MMEWLSRLWRPGVEILILAVAIYYVAVLVRGTRGAAIFTGLLVLVLGMALLTVLLELDRLKLLITLLTPVFSITLVVIFQPELRRLLAKLGDVQLFTSAHEQREDVEVIIQTVERLADVRIGALMAIEQSVVLTEYSESGIVVDCEATAEMLECIFFPNNAIHDGGVILKNGRITHAACIFPLSRRQDLNKSLGTRHRAALGLSEETDAIVVAVSEETGMVSYAHQGQMVRGVSVEELRAFLTSQLVRTPSRQRHVVDWLRRLAAEHKKPGPAVVVRNSGKPNETSGTSAA
jgi:diadenylate cyclase